MNKMLYVAGELIKTEFEFDVINPATDEKVETIYLADKTVAASTLLAAKEAKSYWGNASVKTRFDMMQKLKQLVIENEERLRTAVHQETGKTWETTAEDFQSLVDSLEFYSQSIKSLSVPTLNDIEGTHVHTLKYKPVGVVVAFLSWNFPLLNLGFKLGPALAAGCPIILKPSLKAPLSAYIVGELCQQAGFPVGVVSVVCGNDREVSSYLCSSRIPAMLTLIGAINTGVQIMAAGATSIKRHSMELGGNTPFIVCEDADLDLAADILTGLKFGNTGQICVAPNRVFVHTSVKQQLIDKVMTKISQLKIGFGRDEQFDMGPLIDKRERDRVHALVCDALEKGATNVHGGEFIDGPGAFYEPTLLTDIKPNMEMYKEEIFGPVISMIDFDSIDDVIERANDTDTGLASYVFSKSGNTTSYVANKLEFGEVQINGVKYGINLPHVGIKQSGIGCDCSVFAMMDYLTITRVTEQINA